MIKSILEPDKIRYKSNYGIDEEDIDYAANIYDYELHNISFEIALGKIKYIYSNHGILHCSLYLIMNDSPVSKIGIFEISENDILSDINDDGLELEKGHILIFATEKYINKMINKEEKKKPIEINESIPEIDSVIDITDVNDVMKIDIKEKMTEETEKSMKILDNGLFVKNENKDIPSLLPEESQIESEELTNEYKESKDNTWIETFMKNNEYSIIENEGCGDCFFAVIRDAYRQIGKDTTVKKLRALLSKEITNDHFNEYKTLYTNFSAEYESIEAEMNANKKKISEIKRRIINVSDKEEHNKLLEEATELSNRFKELSEHRILTKNLLNEFLYMQDIDSIEKLQEYVMKSQYWADEWALSTLERVLNIKLIIFDEKSYVNEDNDSIMTCGPNNNGNTGSFVPDHYIMTSYTGDHYTLITYKDKQIFKFREIPFNVKNMIVNKCLERNSGIYYLIDDFKNYKTKLGLDANYGEPLQDDDVYLNKNIYDNDVVFMFHSLSNSQPKSGKGVGEKIVHDKILEYKNLNTTKKTDILFNWRRKLDDSWATPFTVDDNRWNTVTHFLLGSQYKKGFPDFYKKFSLDSESEISTNLDMAIGAASKTGKYKNELLRPDNVTVDADYYDVGRKSKEDEERYKALLAKFTQNQDLKKVLMETNRAKLVHFIRRDDPITDMILMKIRKEIS
tara:strand:+ start:2593 stop:4638 length:2046 start_codon:yes stop_codon:yes gene_type:complete